MEESLKDYLAKQLLNKKFRFVCNCIISMNVTGTIKDYDIINNEIIFIVESKGKLIKIGENHPKLKIIPL